MNEKTFLDLYKRQQESGLSIVDFCSNEIIAPSSFHYWKKKMKNKSQSPDFIPLVVNNKPKPKRQTQNKVFPITGPGPEYDPLVKVEFPNGTIIRVKNNLDLPTLKALIHLYD